VARKKGRDIVKVSQAPPVKLFLVLVLLAGAALVCDLRRPEKVAPVREIFAALSAPGRIVGTTLGEGARSAGAFFESRRFLVDENRRLRRENGFFREALLTSEEVFHENFRLASLLDLSCEQPQPLAARVVGRSRAGWNRSIMLDRGRRHGVLKDSAVVSVGGVVGQVIEVWNSSCRVQLLVDELSGVPCYVQRTRVPAILSGEGSGWCSLSFYRPHRGVTAGDLLLTSGLGGVYPKGLPVGRVVKVSSDTRGALLNVRVAPAVDLDHLEEVMIMLFDHPTSEVPETPAGKAKVTHVATAG
jgi:rod shape-determining protein MreC